MLKNLKVRTKLAVVLLVPLVALVAIGAVGVLDRQAEAADAREDKQVAELLAARVELAHQLQVERVWLSLSGSTAISDQLAANQAAFDAARADYERRAAAVRGIDPGLAEALDDARERLAELTAARPSSGRPATAAAVSSYDAALDALGRVGVAAGRAGGAVARLDRGSMIDLAELKASYSALAARATGAITAGLPSAQLEPLRQQLRLVEQQEQAFRAGASDEARAEYDRQISATSAAADKLSRFVSTGADRVVPSDLTAWTNDVAARLTGLRQVEAVLTNRVGNAAADAESDATAAARNFALAVGGVVLLSLLLASLVAGSIARPIGRLTTAANTLAEERLPALVEQLRNPSKTYRQEPVALPVDSKDEVGQLARALQAIQGVTHSVADEQATLLRKGIADIFVNLARRNQTLLDRQIEFLDQLEAGEEDPDLLENLFKLDHLATRMRRNAESLLVLAGAEPARRRGRPVDVTDVVRVAVGEVEHFARVQLLSVDDATVAGGVAVDLAHLLSELMENATQFSPPDTRVEVIGRRAATGDYRIVVTDQGIGMSAEQLADANARIADPAPVGLTISRSLGFTVIGRLAQRHGLAVQLAASATGGVAASVVVPAAVIDPAVPAAPAGTTRPAVAAPAPAAPPATAELPFFSSGPVRPPTPMPSRGAADEAPAASAVTPPVLRPSTPPAPTWADAPAAATPAPPATTAPPVPPASPDTDPWATVAPVPQLAVDPPTAPPAPPAAAAPPVPPVAPPAPPAPVAPVAEDVPFTPPWDVPTSWDDPNEVAPAPPVAPAPFAAAPAPLVPPVAPPPLVATPDLPPLPTRGAAPVAPPPDAAPLPTRAPAAPSAPGASGDLPVRTPVTPPGAGVDALEGLTRRVPKRDEATSRPDSGPARATQRSPEEVREMLSRYRSGLKKGRTDDDGTPQVPPA